jgi:hypothetical protein
VGEGKQRRKTLAEMVAASARCVYCPARPDTVEHMPAIGMFSGRQRLKGLEFPCCDACNQGTRAADLVASYLARLPRSGGQSLVQEARALHPMLRLRAPGFLEELNRGEKQQLVLNKTRGGVARFEVAVQVDGPLATAYLRTYGAKLGMALFYEHVGQPLPEGGAVHVQPYLNAGLAEAAAHAMLSILPAGRTLRQGRLDQTRQFAYRYNSDEKSVVAALVGFHSNLHFFLLATTDMKLIGAIPAQMRQEPVFAGRLLGAMPPTLSLTPRSPSV